VTARAGAVPDRTAAEGMLRNTMWMVWSGTISIANSVVVWLAMARWRSPDDVGQFATVMALQTVFVTICGLGLEPYLASQLASHPDRRRFVASATLLVSVWSGVCMAVMIASGWCVSTASAARVAAAVLSLSVLPTGLMTIGEAIFIAGGKARVIAVATTAENLLRTVVPLVLLARGAALPAVCASFVAVRLAACAVYLVAGRRALGPFAAPELRLVRDIARVAPTFAGITVLATIHAQLGMILAARLGGDQAAAHFGIASRFLVPVTLLLTSYGAVLQPEASRVARRSIPALRRLLVRSAGLSLAVVVPLAVGGMVFGPALLGLLFGARYEGASGALALLGISLVPFTIVIMMARGLVATGRQHIDLLANLAAVVINVAANVILIPRYGATGAGWALLLSTTVMAAIVVGAGTRHAAPHRVLPRVLMVGVHPARTLGGISTLVDGILRSSLSEEFEFRHVVSQADGGGAMGKLARAATALARFGWALATWSPDAVYVHVGGRASLYREAVFIGVARLTGRRVLTHLHAGNFESYFAAQGPLGRRFIIRGLGWSSRFVAVSHEMAGWVRRRWPQAEVGVVPNGVEVSTFAGPRRYEADVPRLLFVGKMGYLKGEADLLCALARVRSGGAAPLPFRLDLVGQLSPDIRARIDATGLSAQVDHLGPVPLQARRRFFERADVFVLPTYAEGTPIAVLEAMAAGLPVITTPVGGIPELIEDGVDGLLVPPGDDEALASRLALLLGDAALRRRLGERARRRALDFDWPHFVARLGTALRAETGA